MEQSEAEKFVGNHVEIHTVDGHRIKAYLHGVGYRGVRLLVNGTREHGPDLADIIAIKLGAHRKDGQ
jgi:uncharacterized membrane-anchored protein